MSPPTGKVYVTLRVWPDSEGDASIVEEVERVLSDVLAPGETVDIELTVSQEQRTYLSAPWTVDVTLRVYPGNVDDSPIVEEVERALSEIVGQDETMIIELAA